MGNELTLEELAELTAAPADQLREWRSLGLIGRESAETFRPEDVQRIRLIQLLLRRGIGLDAIAGAEKEQGFLARYIEVMFPCGVGAISSLPEVARILGVDPGSVERFLEASGLRDQANLLDEEDVQALKAVRIALEAGFPEKALVQLAHVYADALGRVAEAETRLFHFYVHERLKTQGLAGNELMAASDAARSQMEPLVEPLVLYFHRRGMERARREDAVMHLQEDVGLVGPAQVPGQLHAAIVFVDLASFTPLTVAMGDQVAAEVLERFSRIVREAVSRREGRVVKQLGDAFMLMFLEPRSAVTCALEIEHRTAAEPQFPAVRSGLHWGRVLYREGDYVGASVNVAARVAAEAQRSWHFPRLTRHATSATLSAWLRSPSSSPRGTSCAAFSSGKDYRFPTTRNSEKTRASSRFVAGTGRDDHHDRDIQARWARSAVGNCSDFFQRRNGTRCAYGCRHGRRRPDAACAGGRSRRPRGRRDLACRRGSLMARSDRDR